MSADWKTTTENYTLQPEELIPVRRLLYEWLQRNVGSISKELGKIINNQESLNVEFKLVYNAHSPQELLESVVSFANTNGGIIIIGVDNKGNIKGIEKDSSKSIKSQILHLCDPPPQAKIGIEVVNGKKVNYILVPQGMNPPYTLRRKGIYIRHWDSDDIATRAEIEDLYHRRNLFRKE